VTESICELINEVQQLEKELAQLSEQSQVHAKKAEFWFELCVSIGVIFVPAAIIEAALLFL
jgi:hypothetical protein